MKKFLLAAPLAMVSVLAAHSQAVSVNGGAVQGTITDPTGSNVSGATIMIASPDQGISRTITTDSSGFYSVGPLNPGEYTLTITAPGFQRTEVKTRILTGTATPGSFKLTVGQASETVEVTTGDIQVNTEQAGVADVITREQISTLPINGRNFLDLAQIEPGVQLQRGDSFDPTKTGYTGISVNGVSGRTTRILLDGQDITDEFVGTTIFNVSSGAINEFQLNRSTQDVAGEVTSQGQVLVSTRSGTNKLHGEAFYIFQDQRALDANPNAIAPFTPPPFQRNQYGGSVGFPIIKDKLFMFANAERIQQNSGTPAGLGSIFNTSAIATAFPIVKTPFKQNYETARLDYTGPFGGHYFARGNYQTDAAINGGGTSFYSAYSNRDNTYGIAGGADYAFGKFTHSIRGSYEKFHNFIGDGTASGTYNPLQTASGPVTYRYAGQIYFGPNPLAPQITFQSDKQLRYDGGYTLGSHNIRFGGAMNRILSNAFAAFYGLAPRQNVTATNLLAGTVTAANPGGLGCNGVAGAASCASDPLNGYNVTSVTISNNQGYSNTTPLFGLVGGGTYSWRFSAYVADAWKVTPSLSLTAGVRWSVDTARAANSFTQPTCADVATSLQAACTGLPSTTKITALFNPDYTQDRVHQPYLNFAPQAGVIYAPGNHKTVFRAGFGLFYESVVFNNQGNSEGALQKTARAYTSKNPCTSAFNITYPDGSVVTTSPDGTTFQNLCQRRSAAQSAPQFAAAAKAYQAAVASGAAPVNGSYIGSTLNVDGSYAQPFRTPLSEQWNFGVQREIFKGGIISADYIHNMTWRVSQRVDLNHVGAARTFSAANGLAAINRLATANACPTAATATASPATVQCLIGKGQSIAGFATQGLDGAAYGGSSPYTYAGKPTPAAFAGLNPNLGVGTLIRPTGRSGYDALQVVYRQSSAHPIPYVSFIERGNFQVAYNLSRIVSNINSSDQFFGSGLAFDYDNPNTYIGRNALDRKHQLNLGGSMTFKYGPQIGLIGHFYSAQAGTLALDGAPALGNLFTSDITGDGTAGDIAPGTLPGDYMHRINGSTLGNYIRSYNAQYAGKLTPAGQAVVNSGLITAAQLATLGGVIQPVANLPQATGVNNPAFRTFDASFSYPIRAYWLHEGLSLEPKITFYNVANLSNFSTASGTLQNTTTAGGVLNTGAAGQGQFTGTNSFGVASARRTYRGLGTFSQGAPRQTEFQLTLNF